MKKIIAAVLLLGIVGSIVVGCAPKEDAAPTTTGTTGTTGTDADKGETTGG